MSDKDLREALMRWLAGRVGGMCWEEAPWQEWGDEAGEILALPEVAALLADRERHARQRAAEELRAAADDLDLITGARWIAVGIRSRADALTSEATP